MARRKLKHFAEMAEMPHVLEFPKAMQGAWHQFFGNQNPIVVEIGCGTGAYTVGLAALDVNNNYIGIDIKGNRMWHGAKAIEANAWKHAAFLRTKIEQLQDYFAPAEVAEAWITFPDPQPRVSRAKKRLPGTRYLRLLHSIMVPNGQIHLKTDDQDLFEYALSSWQNLGLSIAYATNNLYAEPPKDPRLCIETVYEARFKAQGKSICYANATLPLILPQATNTESNLTP